MTIWVNLNTEQSKSRTQVYAPDDSIYLHFKNGKTNPRRQDSEQWLLLRSKVPTGKGRDGDFMGTGDALYGAVPVSH